LQSSLTFVSGLPIDAIASRTFAGSREASTSKRSKVDSSNRPSRSSLSSPAGAFSSSAMAHANNGRTPNEV